MYQFSINSTQGESDKIKSVKKNYLIIVVGVLIASWVSYCLLTAAKLGTVIGGIGFIVFICLGVRGMWTLDAKYIHLGNFPVGDRAKELSDILLSHKLRFRQMRVPGTLMVSFYIHKEDHPKTISLLAEKQISFT